MTSRYVVRQSGRNQTERELRTSAMMIGLAIAWSVMTLTKPHAVNQIDSTIYIHIQRVCVQGDTRLEFPEKRVPKRYRKWLR